jgi:hypothetical protein
LLENLVLWRYGKALEFEVRCKPLSEQAMEQQGASPNPGQQPGQQGSQNGMGADGGDDGGWANSPDNPRRMGLAHEAIGAGVLNAAELVKAARRIMRRRVTRLGSGGPRPGDREVRNGVTYELNQNHRWERVDDDSEAKEQAKPEWEHKSSHKTVADFIDDVTSNPNSVSKANVVVAKVDSEQAGSIKQATGIDVSGHAHYLDGSAVIKILKDHGNEKDAGLSVKKEDFALLGDVFASPDLIEDAGKTKQGLQTLRFTKRFNGRIVVVEEIRSKNRLAVKTMYKTRAKRRP